PAAALRGQRGGRPSLRRCSIFCWPDTVPPNCASRQPSRSPAKRDNVPMGKDWQRWHRDYETPGSSLARRLVVVRRDLDRALHEAPRDPDGSRRLISLCAGDGRDVLPVLAAHPAGRDVRALLIELDPDLSAAARATAAGLGLTG